jgi:hypothetical protein
MESGTGGVRAGRMGGFMSEILIGLVALLLAVILWRESANAQERDRIRLEGFQAADLWRQALDAERRTSREQCDRLQARSLAELDLARRPVEAMVQPEPEHVDADWMDPSYSRPPVNMPLGGGE